jgi:hypothetical protein
MKIEIPNKSAIRIYKTAGLSAEIPGNGPVQINQYQYPGPWSGSTWTYTPATGLWVNTPVPTTEHISDPTMDTAANWGIGAGWDVSVTTPGKATKVGGVSSSLINTTGGLAAIAGKWYQITGDYNITAGSSYRPFMGNSETTIVDASGTARVITCRATGTTKGGITSSASVAGTVDNFHILGFSLADLIAIRNYNRQAALATQVIVPAYLQGGVIVRYSDINNFIVAYHNRTNAYMDTVIGGTWVNKIAIAAAYADSRVLEIRWASVNSAQLWYNGTQIGADQDVSTVPAGNWAGLFGTDPTVGMTTPVVS